MAGLQYSFFPTDFFYPRHPPPPTMQFEPTSKAAPAAASLSLQSSIQRRMSGDEDDLKHPNDSSCNSCKLVKVLPCPSSLLALKLTHQDPHRITSFLRQH
ncbi:hypothetical protein CDL15_Pgr019074 [Punica granatum]|uniref:Uncharacterized protein n=1 Tax=Punica granatum TaxID=22663 RepID=A0A218XL11_PUNGR|nr:hypothetical protein CDL15_Pgr019074 [Punica granatum]PKI42051.1 hypothetical protein CRG98_037504 [Punica granatum]